MSAALIENQAHRCRRETAAPAGKAELSDAPSVDNSIVELRDVDPSKAVVRGDAHLRASMGEGAASLARI